MGMRDLEILASAGHGGLVVLHLLGIIFNIRKKNKTDVIIHSLALLYSAVSLKNHAKNI